MNKLPMIGGKTLQTGLNLPHIESESNFITQVESLRKQHGLEN